MPDREKVIKGLEVCVDRVPGKYTCDKCPYETDGNDCEINLTKDAIVLLKEQTEWIPVSERLPNDNEDILAYCVYEEESCVVHANYVNGKFYNRIFDSVMRCEITHWMPLTKPPKKCEGTA